MNRISIQVVGPGENTGLANTLYLTPDDWDDWFSYETLHRVRYSDSEGEIHHLGYTKIGRFGLQPAKSEEASHNQRTPNVPHWNGSELSDQFFSLGQDVSYYEEIRALGEDRRVAILTGLRDIAFDERLLERAINEQVARVSLLRSVDLATVKEQFRRVAKGGAVLTPFHLSWTLRYTEVPPYPQVKFEVTPDSKPPTNVHVIVGRNGVGKTTFLRKLSHFMVNKYSPGKKPQGDMSSDEDAAIANLVHVSFSAFDRFQPARSSEVGPKEITSHFVGLYDEEWDANELTEETDSNAKQGEGSIRDKIRNAAKQCLQQDKRQRWVRAIRRLESDPVFAGLGIPGIINNGKPVEEIADEIADIFETRLSSGHKIVLLAITKLVETVAEKSLVLIDEPEAHLHPPLLSSYMRALSGLLIERNGLAIIATHSPVVLQEVPRSCVWKFSKGGGVTKVERPEIETFGENVGTLTNEIFGLEVTSTGFHQMLWEAAEEHETYEAALASFDGQLGGEGRAILRAITTVISAKGNGSNVAR